MENNTGRSILSFFVIVTMVWALVATPFFDGSDQVYASSKIKKKTVKVRFKASGAKFVKQTVKNSKGKKVKSFLKIKKVKVGKKYGKLPKVTKTGYSFKGWYTNKKGGKKIMPGKKVKVNKKKKNQTLYAHWIPNKYTVKFDSKGGYSVKPLYVRYKQTYGKLPVPKRPGCVFRGWYNSKDNRVYNSTKYNILGNNTLYARWNVGSMGVGSRYLEALGKTVKQIPGLMQNSGQIQYEGKIYAEYYDGDYNYYIFENGSCVLVEGYKVMPNLPATGISKSEIDSEYGKCRPVHTDDNSSHKVYEYTVENTYIKMSFLDDIIDHDSWNHVSIYNYEYLEDVFDLFA